MSHCCSCWHARTACSSYLKKSLYFINSEYIIENNCRCKIFALKNISHDYQQRGTARLNLNILRRYRARKQNDINKHRHINEKMLSKSHSNICREAKLPKRPHRLPANQPDPRVCISNRNYYEDNEKCQTFQWHAEHGRSAAPFSPCRRSSSLDLIGRWAS